MRENLVLALLLIFVTDASFGDDAQSGSQVSLISVELTNLESDQMAIETVWFGFKAALLADDADAALLFVNPDIRDEFEEMFKLIGQGLSTWPSSWSEIKAIEIGDEIAIYVFTQVEDDGEKIYSVYFVRHPDRGWVIQQL